MTEFTVAQAARICGGALEGAGGDARIARVQIDSRLVGPGDLFVALPGSRVHGHRFVRDALERGAAACIVGTDAPPLPKALGDRAQIRVKYPRKSLADLAAAHRRTLRCPVVAVTGTNGKSSTREMIAAVLAPLGEVVQSEKSFNNDLGVPLTILRAGRDTAALVVEIGTGARGEIRHLAGITRPDVAVVTNVGAAHLSGLGSVEGVALEKGCLAEVLPRGGALILNADDPRVVEMASRTDAERIVTYSLHRSSATVWGHDPRRTEEGGEFWLYGKLLVSLPVVGIHNLSNALAAVAVGLVQGISAPEIAAGLAQVTLPDLRMEVRREAGIECLLDCYNSNPASLSAATLELEARAPATTPGRRRVAIVGDMLELGMQTQDLHRAAAAGVAARTHVLWCVGRESKALVEGALDAGMHPEQVFWSATTEAAIGDRHVTLCPGDVVLFKGSRAIGLEALAEALLASAQEESPRVAEPSVATSAKSGNAAANNGSETVPAPLSTTQVRTRKVG